MNVIYNFYPDRENLADFVGMGYGTNIRILESNGILDFPDRIGEVDTFGDRHGGYSTGNDPLGIRPVTMTFAVHHEGDDGDLVQATLETMAAAFIKRELDGILVSIRGTTIRFLKCHAKRYEVPATWEVGHGLARGVVEFQATDPRWYTATDSGVQVGLTESSSGRTYPRVYPLSYGGISESGIIALNNAGNMKAYPVMRIYGPVDTPIVSNITEGKFLKFNLEVPDGEYLEVNLDTHAILLNGESNRRSVLDYSSRWFGFAPGLTDVLFSAAVYDADASLEIDLYSAWATA